MHFRVHVCIIVIKAIKRSAMEILMEILSWWFLEMQFNLSTQLDFATWMIEHIDLLVEVIVLLHHQCINFYDS